MNSVKLLLLVALGSGSSATAAESQWRPLFNGRDLDGWTVTLQEMEPGKDPERLVQIHDGAIHMYRDVPEGAKVPFGVITTDEAFSDFHLRFEYRWVGKRFAPRARDLRDAGVLYHVKDASKIWPASVECQVQEGDTGDLIFINTGGVTWMHPPGSDAREGQGDPGMLPENGGIPRRFAPSWPYIGRFEEADSPSGWNRVEVIARGAEYAEHIVNGRTIVRLTDFVGMDGEPLDSGKICLQLEGAEITYRNIEIRELGPPAVPDDPLVSFSAVKGQPARTRILRVTNPGPDPLTGVVIHGRDADAFEMIAGPGAIEPGGTGEWTLGFRPPRGAGRYSAGMSIGRAGEGAFVILQGIGLEAFEGENEPPLQDIVHALGIPLDVGGRTLQLDTDAAKTGDGVAASHFVAIGGGNVRVTPLARFSPPGPTPVGIFTRGDETLVEIGQLAGSGDLPDAHQSLFPPLEDGTTTLEFKPPAGPFGFFMKGHHYISFTDPERPGGAEIKHTARIYPVTSFQGRKLSHAWMIGFEEASNGDYQDVVLLVEGVEPEPRAGKQAREHRD